MRGSKATVLTVGEKCKSILASNWQGHLSTIRADATGSKGDIHSSKVKYMVKRGKPYIWIPENDIHNVNTVIDERGSLAVATPFPGPLANLLKSLKKLPSRIALTGDVLPLKDQKAQLASESLKELIQSEVEAIRESSYAVSGVLSSTNPVFTSRSENLYDLLDESQKHAIYKFDIRSCTFIDSNGGTHEVDLEVIQTSKTDILAPYSAMLVDGINQSESRRRALVLFCFTYMNAPVRTTKLTAPHVRTITKRMHSCCLWIERDLIYWARSQVQHCRMVVGSINGGNLDSPSRQRHLTSNPSASSWWKWRRRPLRRFQVTVALDELELPA
ncbi:hypothetical protein EUGRSUZ_J00020 [Eucalyptus grandis]|uniref:Uncharacterized protein n=2 Tax=Eucalyptus grandis TaxID=71139 RepID=A0ACC3J0U0_EUCGR|nr:hypothetical protein EUGRSUZ_J00020 [Eucalyptus grandis]